MTQSADDQTTRHPEGKARVLIFSQRNFNLKVYQCWVYEFEDIIAGLDSVDVCAPSLRGESRAAAATRRLFDRARRGAGALPAPPPVEMSEVGSEYDLFFAVFQFPSQLTLLNTLKGWRRKCQKAVCFLGEVWAKDVGSWSKHLELLREFDHVFLHVKSSVGAVAEVTGRPVHFMPVGVDAEKFCPAPVRPPRVIDCYSMGRRSPATHRALLELAARGEFFYVYDTGSDFSVNSHAEHRGLLANYIKRSRYFISYKHNAGGNTFAGGQEALAARMFEGAAGGAVLLGSAPGCEEYDSCFGWPDAVVHVPYDPPAMDRIIADLDAQPERLAAIRRSNVTNSLRQHDWVYRWGRVLDVSGLGRTPGMEKREKNLYRLAEATENAESALIGGSRASAETKFPRGANRGARP